MAGIDQLSSYITSNILFSLLLGYLMGSLPYGLMMTRILGISDIRKQGSGNIGATNVYRVAGKKLGALTLAMDLLKGVVAIWIAQYFDLNIYATGICCVLGHIFPIWLKFKGGKGVATFIGVVVAWAWLPGLLSALTWLATILLTRVSSLAGLLGVASSLFWIYLFNNEKVLFFSALPLVILVIIRHTSNIKRLLKKEEKSL